MPKTITVKGIGKAAVKPDYVVISMDMESLDKNYDQAMELAADKIQRLNEALMAIGFEEADIKTARFDVAARSETKQDSENNWIRVFKGYEVTHRLKVEFDFDLKRLSETLRAISGCMACPQFSIAFTVKDAADINEQVLRSAAANARRKAEILCDAAGKTLGELLSIDYDWMELNVFSNTVYTMEDECDCEDGPVMAKALHMEPDDIKVQDTAMFVWEIR